MKTSLFLLATVIFPACVVAHGASRGNREDAAGRNDSGEKSRDDAAATAEMPDAAPARIDAHAMDARVVALDAGTPMIDAGHTSERDSGHATDTGPSSMVDSGRTPDAGRLGACENTSDETALAATYDGRSVFEVAYNCGVGALYDTTVTSAFDPDFSRLTSECLDTETSDVLSGGCNTCMTAAVACGAQNCATPCARSQFQCLVCMCGSNSSAINCVEQYEDCAGVPIPGISCSL